VDGAETVTVCDGTALDGAAMSDVVVTDDVGGSGVIEASGVRCAVMGTGGTLGSAEGSSCARPIAKATPASPTTASDAAQEATKRPADM
jgi:hypothetical protein